MTSRSIKLGWVFVGLAVGLVGVPAEAAKKDPKPWIVVPSAKAAVKKFKRKNPAIKQIRDAAIGNLMVYVGNRGHLTPLLGFHDLVACFGITHPKSTIDVGAADGVQILMEKVKFAKGKWDALLKLTQRQRPRRLDTEKYLLLGYIRVGVNELGKDSHKIGVAKIMAKRCLVTAASKPSQKPQAETTAPTVPTATTALTQPAPPKAKPRDVVTMPNG